MKKLIIALMVSTVAIAGVLHAADTKTASKDKDACCEKSTDDKAKSDCCSSKTACSKTPSKSVAMSPKATEQAAH